MIKTWKIIALNSSETIKQAMSKLSSGALRIVLVVDKNDKLVGTITDGDIRRGLLRGLTLEDPIDNVMNINPVFITDDKKDPSRVKRILRSCGVLAAPIVDSNRRVIGLETLDSLDISDKVDTPIVLMAGGFGKRLHPLTEALPKPMLPAGDKPIIECIIDNLSDQGFYKFYITTHYKSEMIEEHFNKERFAHLEIEFVREAKPLGTAGSLYFLKHKIKNDFCVMNADLINNANFRNLLSFHKQQENISTVSVRKHPYQFPFGVIEVSGTKVSSIKEKPTYSFFVNAGIYCFSNKIFNHLTKEEYLDMPDLLDQVMQEGESITAFPLHESWLDIGRHNDYDLVREGLKNTVELA